jgi:hypothetical protein
LTQQNDAPTKGRQADIEITDDMVDAGFGVLLDYETDELRSHEVVRKVYLAMRATELRSHAAELGKT